MTERLLLLCYDGSEDAKHAIREAAAMFGPRRALALAVWQQAAALPPMPGRTRPWATISNGSSSNGSASPTVIGGWRRS